MASTDIIYDSDSSFEDERSQPTASNEKRAQAFAGPGPQHPLTQEQANDPAPPYEASASPTQPCPTTQQPREAPAEQSTSTTPPPAPSPAVPHQPPPPTTTPPLRIAIPQISSHAGAPFLRAYAPALSPYEIPEADFIAFIDAVNRAALSNSALSALDATGTFLSKVPLPIFGLVGHNLARGSKYGNASVSRGGLERHLHGMNEGMFGPRGLLVSVSKGKSLKGKLGLPVGAPLLPPLDFGESAERQPNVWQRRGRAGRGLTAEIRETGIPMEKTGFGDKLTGSQAISDMEVEGARLMWERRRLLQGPRQGRQVEDAEEVVAEQMLWLLIEPIGR